MRNHKLRAHATTALCVLLAGCGVPRLYAPATASNAPGKDIRLVVAPKVDEIFKELRCELTAASVRAPLRDHNYLITILLTLQVDDNLDVTPSISLINPLTPLEDKVSETNTLSLDFGGSRHRTFTTNYYLESAKLVAAWEPAGKEKPAPPVCNSGKLLKLSGDLGIDEIVRDGFNALDNEVKLQHTPTEAADKAIPTFGSNVQFVVTKQVSALGPLWTLKRFKGPSDQKGLVNGKRVNTDSVTLTFTPIIDWSAKLAEAKSAQGTAIDDQIKAGRAVVEANENVASVRSFSAPAILSLQNKLNSRFGLNPVEEQQLRNQLDQVQRSLRTALDQVDFATHKKVEADIAADRANRALSEAESKATFSRADSVSAGQILLNQMILQNLNIQAR